MNGEFIFPLGQSGLDRGPLAGVTSIDPNFTSLHPIWRDWRFVPMLHVAEDLENGGGPDIDGDGCLDGFERWYFGEHERAGDDRRRQRRPVARQEFAAGVDPTAPPTPTATASSTASIPTCVTDSAIRVAAATVMPASTSPSTS